MTAGSGGSTVPFHRSNGSARVPPQSEASTRYQVNANQGSYRCLSDLVDTLAVHSQSGQVMITLHYCTFVFFSSHRRCTRPSLLRSTKSTALGRRQSGAWPTVPASVGERKVELQLVVVVALVSVLLQWFWLLQRRPPRTLVGTLHRLPKRLVSEEVRVVRSFAQESLADR